jgi:capsular exopolysaccharide synthesis family protein
MNYKDSVEQKKNSSPIQINDFKLIWKIIAKNWFIPFLIVPVFYLIGYFYVYKIENVYQASVELLKSNDAFYKGSVISDNSFYGSSRSFVDNSNEIRIITSYDIMKETVDKLQHQLEVSYFLVGRVRTTEQFSGSPFNVLISNINPILYEKKFDFKILNYDEYELKYLSNGVETKKTGKFNESLIDVDFNIQINREHSFVRNSTEQLSKLDYQIVIHDLNNLVKNFKQVLKVDNPDYTNVLVLTMDDIIPQRAILILDTLSQVYINKSVNARFDINERTISYINKQLEDVSGSLNEIEDTMQLYKQAHNILDLDWEREDFFKKLAIFDGRKSGLNLKIDAINDLEKYIIEDKDPEFLPPSIYIIDGDEFLTSSVEKLYSYQIDLNTQLGFSKEINPRIVEIRESIKKLKQNILVYLNNTRNATYKIIENINNEISNYVSEIKSIPPKQREMLNISRKVAVNEGLYNFLLQQRANAKISKATIVPDIKVIDSPRNKGVVSPDKKKIMSTFMGVGLAIALTIIIIRVLFFTTIETVEELKEKTFLSIIGDLPFQKGVSNLGFIVEDSPSSYIAEAFRTLRTNLQYVILNSNKKTILVTSNAPGEGKTFTTINIGAILAKSGKKVVLLELDLHKPRIQKALEMNADIGISTFMVGKNSLDEIVKPTVIQNLYTILSGPIPPNPSDLVLSEKLKELMDYAKANFDYVLIDTPPAGMLADASYLMQYSDINLFVLNTKMATKQVINLFEGLVKDNSIKDVYLVLNGVKRKRSKYYYSRYGYGYGYGYGYNKNT